MKPSLALYDDIEERTLLRRAVSSTALRLITFALLFSIGLLVCLAIPKILDMGHYQVDEARCTCDCFDLRLKGQFFNPQASEFRAIYINWRWESWLIICLLIGYSQCGLKLMGRAWDLALSKRLSWHMLASMLINSWGQIYNFLMLFSYTNDRIYYLLPTQLFFVLTQWLISIPLYILLDRKIHERASPMIVTTAMAVSLAHLLIALQDQGFKHLVLAFSSTRQGHSLRDLLFFLSDLVPILSLLKVGGLPKWPRSLWIAGIIATLWAFYAILRVIFPYNYT